MGYTLCTIGVYSVHCTLRFKFNKIVYYNLGN